MRLLGIKMKSKYIKAVVHGEDKKEHEKRIKKAMHHADKLGEGAKKRKSLHGKDKVETVMKEFKRGTLHSGSGPKVTNRRQAVAIALSEAGLSKKKSKHKK